VSDVLVSNHPDYAAGDRVLAPGQWQTHAVVDATRITRRLADDGLPPSTALGVYGMPGFTAYVGLHEIGKLQPGEIAQFKWCIVVRDADKQPVPFRTEVGVPVPNRIGVVQDGGHLAVLAGLAPVGVLLRGLR
jgi:hypothetical protein